MAALDRALALAQIYRVAVLVGDDLDFDVARVLDEFLDEHTVVAERGLGLVGGALEPVLGLLRVPRDPHPLAATAGGCFQHHRVADLVGDLDRLGGVLDGVRVARHGRDLGLVGELLGLDLVAHRRDRLGARPDERHAGLVERLRELGVLGEKSVARMHRLGAGVLDRLQDAFDHQIAFRRRRSTDVHRLVGHLHVQRVAIGI